MIIGLDISIVVENVPREGRVLRLIYWGWGLENRHNQLRWGIENVSQTVRDSQIP